MSVCICVCVLLFLYSSPPKNSTIHPALLTHPLHFSSTVIYPSGYYEAEWTQDESFNCLFTRLRQFLGGCLVRCLNSFKEGVSTLYVNNKFRSLIVLTLRKSARFYVALVSQTSVSAAQTLLVEPCQAKK